MFALNVTLLVRPAPNIPANVLHVRAAVVTSLTSSVLKSVQLELMQLMEHANIAPIPARAALDQILPVLPVPTEKFSTQAHAMTKVLT